MAILEIITNNPMITGIVVVGSFAIWKFWFKPQMNEGKSLDPTEEEINPPLVIDMDTDF